MSRHWYQPRRLASSVRLPWALGAVAMLALAAVTGSLGGRIDSGVVVPTAVLDAQQASTASAAQQVRRSLNAGLDDLSQLGGSLAMAQQAGDLGGYLTDFAGRYHRYRSVYLIDANRHVVAKAGTGDPHPDAVPAKPAAAGMTSAVKIDSVPVVVQYAPVKLRDKRSLVVAGEYDVSYVRNSLDGVHPATLWVVTSQGEVVASNSGFNAFEHLDSVDLRHAAEQAHQHSGVVTAGGSRSARDILAYAPVHGDGPASGLAWGVVTARGVDTVSLPQTQARRQAMLFAILLTALVLAIFGWLLVQFLVPLRQLVREAERLADGHVTDSVEIRRYDEIGLVGRALERLRIRLIREATYLRTVQDHPISPSPVPQSPPVHTVPPPRRPEPAYAPAADGYPPPQAYPPPGPYPPRQATSPHGAGPATAVRGYPRGWND